MCVCSYYERIFYSLKNYFIYQQKTIFSLSIPKMTTNYGKLSFQGKSAIFCWQPYTRKFPADMSLWIIRYYNFSNIFIDVVNINPGQCSMKTSRVLPTFMFWDSKLGSVNCQHVTKVVILHLQLHKYIIRKLTYQRLKLLSIQVIIKFPNNFWPLIICA